MVPYQKERDKAGVVAGNNPIPTSFVFRPVEKILKM